MAFFGLDARVYVHYLLVGHQPHMASVSAEANPCMGIRDAFNDATAPEFACSEAHSGVLHVTPD